MKKKLIIFTDLDGTLLDSAYSFRKALPAIRLVKKAKIPIIICSSKTRTEIEECRKKLNIEYPFISENGGGIFWPKNIRFPKNTFNIQEEQKYYTIRLGAPYHDLRRSLEELRSEGFDVRGFGDMTFKEVSGLTLLKPSDAKRAKLRDFDEPFVFPGDKKREAALKRRIKSKGYNYTQGVFYHIMGDSDKGRAVNIVKKLYSSKKDMVTVALGDSPNDIEMLQNVDYPIVVQNKDGSYNRQVLRNVRGCIKAEGIGPAGWNRAVIELLSKKTL